MNSEYWLLRENCPVCETESGKLLFSRGFFQPPIKQFLESFYSGRVELEYLENASFELYKCSNCRLIWQRQIPNEYLMKKLYREWISPEESFEMHTMADVYHISNYVREIVSVILHSKTMPAEINVLDFGMGWGGWLFMAKAFGLSAYGTEINDDQIEYVKQNGVDVVTWEEIPQYEFDFINTSQIFEHVATPFNTLRYLTRSLKTGALIKISVPNGKNIERKLDVGDWMAPKGSKNSLNPVSPLEHINCFQHRTVVKMAELAGLRMFNFPFLQVAASVPWDTPRNILKNLVDPFIANLWGTYLFLQKK